ncbi:MAG: DUF2442 domain-containing protein [Rectinemataceae bacterium]
MRIRAVIAESEWRLKVFAEDGRTGIFDVQPYMGLSAFKPLVEVSEFIRVRTGGYYVEWACGADLSADTLESGMVWMTNPRGLSPEGSDYDHLEPSVAN